MIIYSLQKQKCDIGMFFLTLFLCFAIKKATRRNSESYF